MKTSGSTHAQSVIHFQSLLEMRAAYNNLTRGYSETLDGNPPAELLDEADEFLSRGRETGMFLDNPDERWEAQNMLNFWAKTLYRYRRAPGDEPPVAVLSPFGRLPPSHAEIVPFQAPPEPADVYVGRQSFLSDLKQRLLAGRNIALCSAPGTGKTLIATKLAHDPEVRAKYCDGVLWARLGEHPDVSSVLRSWCEVLDMAWDEGDWLDPEQAGKLIRQALGRRRMLSVIDDAWQSDAVMALKLGGPNCAHIVTTYLMTVALDFDAQAVVTVSGLTEEDGLRLLKQQAPRAVEHQENEAKKLVAALDNSPLALSLLANFYRLPVPNGLPDLKKLRERLVEKKETIETERSSAPAQSLCDELRTPSSLLAAIGWCFEHLRVEEQDVLQAFTSFPPKPDSFSESAARYIVEERSQHIGRLLDYGLLEKTPPDRYSIHRAVSEFLKSRARTDHAPERRMADFFVDLVKAQATNLQVLEQEEKNILAALETAYEQGMWRRVVDGTNALFGYFDRQGLYVLAKKTLNRARKAAERSNDEQSLAAILLKLGEIEERRSECTDARQHFQEALDIAKSLRNPEVSADLSAHALQGLGVVAMAVGQYDESERYLKDALDLARQIRNTDRECAIETRLGWLERARGKFDQMRARTKRALDLARSLHYIRQAAELELSLGVLDFVEGKYEQAKERDYKGLAYAEQARDKRLQCALHQALGGVEIELQNFDQAEAHLIKSLHLSIEIGHRWYNGVIWKEIGELRLKQNLPNPASSAFKKAVELARQVNSSELMGMALYGLARVAEAQKNLAEARLQGRTSLNIFQSMDHYKKEEVITWINHLENHTLDEPEKN